MTNGIATKLLSAILVRDLALCTSFICWLQKSKNFLMRLDCYLVPISDGSGFIKLWVWVSQCGEIQDFYIIQILREINFGESRGSETAVFAISRALRYANLVNSSLQKVQKFKKSKFRASRCVKMADFALLESPNYSGFHVKSD